MYSRVIQKIEQRFSSELFNWLYLHSWINIWEYLWIIKRPDKSTTPTQSFSTHTLPNRRYDIVGDYIQYLWFLTQFQPQDHGLKIYGIINHFWSVRMDLSFWVTTWIGRDKRTDTILSILTFFLFVHEGDPYTILLQS